MDIGFGDSYSSEGIVGSTVFEVHWDSRYILAGRHPWGLNQDSMTVIEYYILKKVKFGEAKARDNMFGPLTNAEYHQKLAELNLDESKMESIIFADLK